MYDPEADLAAYFDKVFKDEILAKFKLKNTAYAKSDDEFRAFRLSAQRWLPAMYKKDPYEAMFFIMGILQDKHLAALPKGFDVYEFRDRLLDVIVYALFGLAFYDAKQKEKSLSELAINHEPITTEADVLAHINAVVDRIKKGDDSYVQVRNK